MKKIRLKKSLKLGLTSLGIVAGFATGILCQNESNAYFKVHLELEHQGSSIFHLLPAVADEQCVIDNSANCDVAKVLLFNFDFKTNPNISRKIKDVFFETMNKIKNQKNISLNELFNFVSVTRAGILFEIMDRMSKFDDKYKVIGFDALIALAYDLVFRFPRAVEEERSEEIPVENFVFYLGYMGALQDLHKMNLHSNNLQIDLKNSIERYCAELAPADFNQDSKNGNTICDYNRLIKIFENLVLNYSDFARKGICPFYCPSFVPNTICRRSYDAKLECLFAPGHTEDSSIQLDKIKFEGDKVLFNECIRQVCTRVGKGRYHFFPTVKINSFAISHSEDVGSSNAMESHRLISKEKTERKLIDCAVSLKFTEASSSKRAQYSCKEFVDFKKQQVCSSIVSGNASEKFDFFKSATQYLKSARNSGCSPDDADYYVYVEDETGKVLADQYVKDNDIISMSRPEHDYVYYKITLVDKHKKLKYTTGVYVDTKPPYNDYYCLRINGMKTLEYGGERPLCNYFGKQLYLPWEQSKFLDWEHVREITYSSSVPTITYFSNKLLSDGSAIDRNIDKYDYHLYIRGQIPGIPGKVIVDKYVCENEKLPIETLYPCMNYEFVLTDVRNKIQYNATYERTFDSNGQDIIWIKGAETGFYKYRPAFTYERLEYLINKRIEWCKSLEWQQNKFSNLESAFDSLKERRHDDNGQIYVEISVAGIKKTVLLEKDKPNEVITVLSESRDTSDCRYGLLSVGSDIFDVCVEPRFNYKAELRVTYNCRELCTYFDLFNDYILVVNDDQIVLLQKSDISYDENKLNIIVTLTNDDIWRPISIEKNKPTEIKVYENEVLIGDKIFSIVGKGQLGHHLHVKYNDKEKFYYLWVNRNYVMMLDNDELILIEKDDYDKYIEEKEKNNSLNELSNSKIEEDDSSDSFSENESKKKSVDYSCDTVTANELSNSKIEEDDSSDSFSENESKKKSVDYPCDTVTANELSNSKIEEDDSSDSFSENESKKKSVDYPCDTVTISGEKYGSKVFKNISYNNKYLLDLTDLKEEEIITISTEQSKLSKKCSFKPGKYNICISADDIYIISSVDTVTISGEKYGSKVFKNISYNNKYLLDLTDLKEEEIITISTEQSKLSEKYNLKPGKYILKIMSDKIYIYVYSE